MVQVKNNQILRVIIKQVFLIFLDLFLFIVWNGQTMLPIPISS